jgi:RNase H-fold protein (predicted Holliday junction resolvase)
MTDEQLLERINQIVASPVKTTQQEHSSDLKSLKGKVNRIDKTLNITIRTFDERIVSNTREIDLIKGHLGLPPKH